MRESGIGNDFWSFALRTGGEDEDEEGGRVITPWMILYLSRKGVERKRLSLLLSLHLIFG